MLRVCMKWAAEMGTVLRAGCLATRFSSAEAEAKAVWGQVCTGCDACGQAVARAWAMPAGQSCHHMRDRRMAYSACMWTFMRRSCDPAP